MLTLGLRDYPLAVSAAVSVNAVSKFLKGTQHDLRMDTASKIYLECQKEAAEQGVTLSDLGVTLPEAAE